MQETIRKYTTQIKDKWISIDKSLRIKMIIIASLLIVALALTIYLTAKPKWIVLESNSDIQTIGQIQNAFDDAQIKNKLVKNGTAIQVLQKDVNQAKVLLAEKNIPTKGFSFADAVNIKSMGMSESDKDQMYLRVRESEIEELITTIDGVETAKVKLVLPKDQVLFENSNQEASAGVTVETSQELSKDQTMTIARLVAMSVQGLDIKNVEIVDQNANSLYSGSSRDLGSYSSREDVEQQKTKAIEMKIRAALSQMYSDVNIIPNIVFDWNNSVVKERRFDKPDPESEKGLPKTEVSKTEDVVNGTQGAAPGTDTNNQQAPNYAMGDNNGGTYNGEERTDEYLYNQTDTETSVNGGKIVSENSSISVIVYDFQEYREADLKANNTINDQNTWEDFKQNNRQLQPIDINQDIITSLQVGTGIENVSVTGYIKPVFIDEVTKPLAIEQIVILVILGLLLMLLAFGLIKRTQPDKIEEVEPEIGIEGLIAQTKIEDKEEENVPGINEVESAYKQQIEKFVDEKPEAVAQLLRNWLSDEWE